jgi:spermidine synthase
MGTTVRSAVLWPDTEVEAVELVPSVVEALPYFHDDGEALLKDRRVTLHVGDGRNWLLLSGKKYDVISVDPAPPIFSAGTVNLYSQEFMQLAKAGLTENGVAMFWVSSAVTPEEFRMLMSTFRSVFPQGTVWSGRKIKGYFLIGARSGPLRVDPGQIRHAYTDPALRADILEWDDLVPTPESILDLYAAGQERMKSVADGAPIITDNNPWVEFPLFRYLKKGQKRFKKKHFVANRDPITPVLVTP